MDYFLLYIVAYSFRHVRFLRSLKNALEFRILIRCEHRPIHNEGLKNSIQQ